MTNVMYQDLTVKNTIDATSIGAGLIAAIRDALLPVGSVVCCTTSPAGRIGGTWAQIEDKFILAAGTTYAEDSEGGEAAHVLTINEMPAHQFDVISEDDSRSIGVAYGGNPGRAAIADVANMSNLIKTNILGGDQPHNTMPPYVAKKYWERTA